MNKRFTLVLLFVFSVQQSHSNIFSSTAHLQKSKNAAFGLRNDLREYIAGEELRLLLIKSHWNSLHTTENGWTEKLIDTVYKLRLEISGKESPLKFSLLYVHAAALPKPDDIQGIIVSIPGLQNVYNLTASQIAMGEYKGHNLGSLSAPACFDIGIYLAISQYYRLSIEWVNTALHMATYCMGDTAKGECINEQFINDIQVTLPKIEDDFGKLKSITFKSIDEMIKKGTPVNSFITAEDWKILRDSNTVKYFGPEYLRNFPITQNFEKLCSKQDTRKGGFCTVRRNTRMGYYEMPRKVELINKSPLMIMLHDVVDDRYINLLTKSSNRLSRSSIIAPTATTESNLRTSKTYWLDDYEISVTKRINGILEEQTGFRLNRGSTENLQVVNYGIGGQYQPHYDFLPNTPAGSQRLATMLIYLSDVELGGSTVFPSLDIAVAPVKGSVLIFANLDEHGDGIKSTLHGGCPVFLGSKWIANKWVQLNGQDVNFRAIKPSAWTDVLSS